MYTSFCVVIILIRIFLSVVLYLAGKIIKQIVSIITPKVPSTSSYFRIRIKIAKTILVLAEKILMYIDRMFIAKDKK